MDNSKNTRYSDTTLRRVQSQAKDRSYNITIPKIFAGILKIKKGDYVRISNDGSKLIFEKVVSDVNFLDDSDDNRLFRILSRIKALIIEIAIDENPHTEIHISGSDLVLAKCNSKDEFIRKFFPEIFDQIELDFDIDREEIEKKLHGKIQLIGRKSSS
jgi:bifunctional DNA-binding transcriptional regulator/antitoxin component of YhaV-PrlF toxin-antitoxin module